MLCPHFSECEIRELPVADLRGHEEIELARFQELLDRIQRNGAIDAPILVDRGTKIILDGHHRYHVFKYLGWEKIRCCLVDYRADWIEVQSRRPGFTVSKAEVIRRALNGELFPSKTTKHIVHQPQCARCKATADGETDLAFSPEKL